MTIQRGFLVRVGVGSLAVSLGVVALFACAKDSEDATRETVPGFSSGTGSTTPPPTLDAAEPEEDAGSPSEGGSGYSYGPWGKLGGCSVPCDAGTRARKRECRRNSDGLPVDCRNCGGECVDDSTPCVGVSTCCGPRETCCPPNARHNIVAGEMATCNTTLEGVVKRCEAKGCLWNGASACSIGGGLDGANPTLPGAAGLCE